MKLLKLNFWLCLAMACLTFTACEEGGADVDAPNVSTSSSTDVDAMPGDTVTITLSASEGASPLRAITVREDGTTVPLDRVLIDGAAAAANPSLLLGADKVSFTKQVGVIVHRESTAKTYTFTVDDEASRTGAVSVLVTVQALPPDFTIPGDGDIQAAPNTLVSIPVEAVGTGAEIDQISVKVNGELITNLNDLELGGVDFTANPNPVTGEDRNGFMKSVTMRTPMTVGTYTVTIAVIDENGVEVSDDLVVIVGTTPVTYMGSVFWNADGPNQGGLDLDTGEMVGRNSTESEVRDLGNDTNQPIATNWRRQIEARNNFTLAQLIPGENNLPETFSFEDVLYGELIQSYNGNVVDLPNNQGTVSGTLKVGDIFWGTRGNKYYIFVVREIVMTVDNNEDYYVVDIKVSE